MNNNELQAYIVEETEDFDKSVVRFIKKKKFKKLPNQIENLINELEKGNFSGDLLTRHYIYL